MSKNVAVFVDVANIFYAAKAAGVDIDYVTLLKSATAGRDFVRAYAYTGLDPENENQRQFHSFLARSGYKVISKDIRKYGDGRIKANLDIELVVDMMRMAQHIDVAVVVSGDGDFAPAIRAVQQMGVRAEVVSFRGNTSSDLIDVADVFTDITQIARVEKGARSGRRVAAEGDLSMTEVPEKETEGLARRRRTRRPERPDEQLERPEVAERGSMAAGMAGNLIVLPGERLSRVAGEAELEPEVGGEGVQEATWAEEGPGTVAATAAVGPGDAEGDAEGRRRRRRRGGRGRGRGRQGEAETAGPVGAGNEPVLEDEEFLEEEIAPLPQHSTFGSVWDSQLAVSPMPPVAAAAAGPLDDEDFEDEPEIPEYLLAERRQQQRGRGRPMRQGQGGGCRRPGYQSAVDRERYGRAAGSTGGGSGFAGSGSGFAGGPRLDRARPTMAGNRGPRPQQPRSTRPPYQAMTREVERTVPPSSEPWSEVPADVQELLRAELARRQGSRGQSQAQPQSELQARSEVPPQSPVGPEPGVAFTASFEPQAEPVSLAPAPSRRRGRSVRSVPASPPPASREPSGESSEIPEGSATAGSATNGSSAPPRRARRATTAAAARAVTEQPTEPAVAPPARTRRARPAATEASEPETGTVPPKTGRASPTRSRAASAAAGGATAEPAGAGDADAAPAPRRRATRKSTRSAPPDEEA